MALRRATVTMVPESGAPDYVHHFESICELLETQNRHLRRIARFLEAQALRPDVDTDIYLSTTPTSLSRSNRRQTRMWVPNAANVLINNLHGGFAPFTLQAGWNYLDLVEGAQIMLQSGPGFSALWQALDTVTSGASL
jgi:hypothetical protein